MLTVDQLLIKLTSNTSPTIEELIPARDSKVLRSLSTAVVGQKFITENQSKLLVKIIKDHTTNLSVIDNQIQEIVTLNNWSRMFRAIERVRRFYINNIDGTHCLDIEFTFDSAIRKVLAAKMHDIDQLIQLNSGKLFRASLTEKNIVVITDLLKKYNFDVDARILEHYDVIKSWKQEEVVDRFKITNIVNSNFQKQITQDLGLETAIDQNIINDRSHRYQYFVDRKNEPYENLTEQIANRTHPKIWIDHKVVSMTDIIKSLIELKRAPILFVFDAWDSKKCLEELQGLAESLEQNNVADNVGIYFRLNNDTVGKEFNQLIASSQYNKELNENTEIVGIQSGKIPKFLLTTKWKPMSIVCIGNSLKQSKTIVYSNICDLIIQYSDSKPLIEPKVLWE